MSLRKIKMPNGGIFDSEGNLTKAGHHYLEQLQQVPGAVADIQDQINAVGSIGELAGLDTLDRDHLATGFGTVMVQSQELDFETGYINVSTIIPLDNTTPQITEGVEILTGSFTPVSATSELLVEFWGIVGAGAGNTFLIAALFQDGATDAVASSVVAVLAVGVAPLWLGYRLTPASLNSITFALRLGPNSTAGTSGYLNGNSAAQMFNGTMRAFLRVSEFEAR